MNIKPPDYIPENQPVDPIFNKVKNLEEIMNGMVHVERFEKAINAYLVKFTFGDAITTVKINIEGPNKENAVITNMTTLPDSEKSKGFGSQAVAAIISWAKENGFKNIVATQVQESAEEFWMRNGFVKAPNYEQMRDFIYNK